MRRASQLVSPLRLPPLSRFMRPQRIAISLMLSSLHASARCDGFAQPTVQHDRAARQALELPSQPADGHVASFAVDGEGRGR